MGSRLLKRSASKASSSRADGAHLPSKEEILRYITENPDRSGKRELARAFNIKGEHRLWLKEMLAELKSEGAIKSRGKKNVRAGHLPPVVVLDIFSRDAEGGLIARPAEEDEEFDGPVPLVSIRVQKGARLVPGVGDRVLARVHLNDADTGPAYIGRVMKIFEKRRKAVLGVLREMRDGTLRIEPVERRQPELIVDTEFANGAKSGDLVEVLPLKSGRYGLPKAKVLEVIGSLSSEKAVSMIAIHAHEIPHIFPADVLAEAEEAEPVTRPSGWREDWRDIPLVTIDPPDAKDHDDAVFAEPDPDQEKNPGGVIVTVAIADVAYYVRSGSALDREALKRGNSVYFPDRVVPMLPERISNDLCSLREGQNRPALAVRMRFSADGRKLSHSFHRVLMRSAARLSYNEAQEAINGKPNDRTGPLLDTVLKPLWDAYEVLKRGRDQREPLDLDLPERKIILKPDGTVDRVFVPPRLDAHKLIEEFMIQANVSAAETLEAARQPFIYRVHDEPSLAKLEALREFLASLGIPLTKGGALRPSQFNAILARVKGTEHEQLVNEVVLRTQSQAVYSTDNFGHFGLNLRRYAHFTSPIRRYADLIVHRALIKAKELGPYGLSRDDETRLEETAALISATERRAMAAERETIDRLVAEHLSSRTGDEFEARISGIAASGIFVQLPDYGADGFIPVSSLGDDYYIFDEARHALVGQRSGRGYQLGSSVDVRLVEVTPLAGAMRFEMLSEPASLPGSSKSLLKARRDAARARRGRKPERRGRRK